MHTNASTRVGKNSVPLVPDAPGRPSKDINHIVQVWRLASTQHKASRVECDRQSGPWSPRAVSSWWMVATRQASHLPLPPMVASPVGLQVHRNCTKAALPSGRGIDIACHTDLQCVVARIWYETITTGCAHHPLFGQSLLLMSVSAACKL